MRSSLYIILSMKDSIQQQIHFNGNIFGNRCCHFNEGFTVLSVWQSYSFVKIDHEIFTVILSLPLIQEGKLSVPGGRMYTILVNRLED